MANQQQFDLSPQSSGYGDNTATGKPSSHQHAAPYLDQAQQNLLLAALNTREPYDQKSSFEPEQKDALLHTTKDTDVDPRSSGYMKFKMDTFDDDFTPDLLDLDENFDFDNADLGGHMIGALPDDDDDDEFGAEQHEKRKADEVDSEGGDAKRQETQNGDKSTKKPGRKPLTNEPTTKRKAQNRAAQRAFRERKEAHLKELETRVSDLTKSQEADKHENGLLRAQVDRLQIELRDYRKRLSLNSGAVKRSPTLLATQPASNPMNFQFDFPKFGSGPSTQLLSNQPSTITPPLSNNSPVSTNYNSQTGQLSRHNSEGRSMSPATQNLSQSNNISLGSSINPGTIAGLLPYSTSDNMHGFASTLPQMGEAANDPFGDLFSPSILKSVSQGGSNINYFSQSPQANASSNDTKTSNGGDSTAGIPDHRVFRFNSTSVGSDSASPSTSSFSHGNTANSSCGTSPEPLRDSPAVNLKSMESTESTNEPQYSFTQLPTQPYTQNLNLGQNNFNVPHISTFDPVLFGDYRDTNDNIVGDGDFTGGFFDDSFNSAPLLDFASPSNLFGILSPANNQAVKTPTPSRNLMAEIEKARDGGDDDAGFPTTTIQNPTSDSKPVNLVSCTKIWNELQSNPDFQDGHFDLDGLCSELRSKARCSETGLMVDSAHVDVALRKLSRKMTEKDRQPGGGDFMFPQQSWDDIVKKLTANRQ